MWQPWSRLFELLGRLQFGHRPGIPVQVGNPRAVDAAGGMGWRSYRGAADLFKVWGPVPGSPWHPYHCVPLFAALDRIPSEKVGPTDLGPVATEEDGPSPLPAHARMGAPPPPWIDASTWTILDLPGRATVKAAIWLIASARCQPVCTFDNWPHPSGLLLPQEILAELLRWATTLAGLRSGLDPDAPPLWICDSERLGRRAGQPGEFDNRYYLDDSVVPGPGILSRSGIRRIVYLSSGIEHPPLPDLEGFFSDFLKAGVPVLHVELTDPSLEPRSFSAPKSPRALPRIGFRRSAAGGFGTEVPEPSSGGGGG